MEKRESDFDFLMEQRESDAEGFALAFASSRGTQTREMPMVVALHARGSDAGSALAMARDRFGDGPDILAPQAARPCNPFQSNLRAATVYSGFSWYLGDDPARPEAASFGDALAQLDLLMRRLAGPFVLCGEGQGAVLAVTLALHAPRGLGGVYARGAALPLLDGWDLPFEELRGVEALFEEIDAPSMSQARAAFEARGAVVTEAVPLIGGAAPRGLQLPDASSRNHRRA